MPLNKDKPLWVEFKCVNTRELCAIKKVFNPYNLMPNQARISPYKIFTISSRQAMRINENINKEIISWSNTKFLELIS